MRAFLFAETRGSRMGKQTTGLPKPMLSVAGKPILQHSVEAIRDGGIKEILIRYPFVKKLSRISLVTAVDLELVLATSSQQR